MIENIIKKKQTLFCVVLFAFLFGGVTLLAQAIPFEDDIDWSTGVYTANTTGNFSLSDDMSWDDIDNTNGAIYINSGNNITANFEGNFRFINNENGGLRSNNYGDGKSTTINFLTSDESEHSLFIFKNNSIRGGLKSTSANNSTITMEATKKGGIFVVGNSSQDSGGGIHSNAGGFSSANLSVDAGSILIAKNTAERGFGGGIYSRGVTSSEVNLYVGIGAIFIIANKAEDIYDGGGIYSYSKDGSSEVDLFVDTGNISIIANKSGHSGGGIFSYGAISSEVDLFVDTGNISIIANKSGHSGGGIYSLSGTGGSSKIDLLVDTGAIFIIANKAEDIYDGGGIHSNGDSSEVDLRVVKGNISIIGNKAGGSGGGIYSHGSTSSVLDLSVATGNLSIIGNKAVTYGGGIFSYVENGFSNVNLSAGDEGQILFTGNKHNSGIANAIYFCADNADSTFALNINIGEDGTATFYDPITATANYDIRVQVRLNADDSKGLFIFDGQDYIDAGAINRYYDMINDTVLHNGTLAIANNVIYGRTSKDSTMTISEGAALLSVQSFDLGREYMKNIINADVTLNNSTLAFINEITDTYHTLNINSLNGNSDIYMNFNSDSGDTDVLDINEGAGGTHSVSSIGIGDGTLLRIADVITVGEETQSNIFTGGGAVTPLYYYNLEQNDDSGNWDLVRSLTETSDVTLDSFGSLSVGWFTQLSNLNKRLGQLHSTDYNTHNEDIWIRNFGGQVDAKFSVPNDVRFKEYNYGLDFGGDWLARNNETSKMIVGLYGGYMRADRNFKDAIQSTGKTTSYYGGLYSTWINNNGLYFDFVTKVQDFRTSFDIDTDSAEFSNYGFGASIESGRPYGIGDGFFIEPRAQVAYLHLNSTKFNFKNSGDQVRINDANIYRFLGGAKFGQLTSVGSDNKPFIWYVSADIEKQISAGGKIETMNESYSSATDGIRSVFGLGFMYDDSDSSQVYFNFESSFGEKYNRPWNIIGGYRKMF